MNNFTYINIFQLDTFKYIYVLLNILEKILYNSIVTCKIKFNWIVVQKNKYNTLKPTLINALYMYIEA